MSNIESLGERALIWAVVETAILDVLGLGRIDNYEKSKTKREALHWIFSKDEKTPFSFLWICGILEIDPKLIKKIVSPYRFTQAPKGGSFGNQKPGTNYYDAIRFFEKSAPDYPLIDSYTERHW